MDYGKDHLAAFSSVEIANPTCGFLLGATQE
jgi:hypothetical protein